MTQPVSLNHFAQSVVRAYRISMTPPYEPVAISLDGGLQEVPHPPDAELQIPNIWPSAAPQADTAALREAAKLLVAAENPVIIADRAARTAAGLRLVTELAETLQAPGRSINAADSTSRPSIISIKRAVAARADRAGRCDPWPGVVGLLGLRECLYRQ